MRIVLSIFMLLIMEFSFCQLPESWLGKYEGTMESKDMNGLSFTYKMGMEISTLTDSSYTFLIIYGEDSSRQERSYLLYNNGPNKFVLDEQNGILLEMSYAFDRLVSVFEIQGALLHVSYIKQKKGIRFELTSSKKSFKTGDIEFEGDKIPEIYSYITSSFQQAELKKVK